MVTVRHDDDDLLPDALELGLTTLVHLQSVTSTMDEVHRLAEQGALAGTCVIADEQTAGRGRAGRSWTSEARRGVWLTLLERPADAAAVDVLSLRLGLVIARVLERLEQGGTSIQLKWPNDVFNENGKVAGVLVEARWRQQAIEWVAIGVGINLQQPAQVVDAAALPARVSRAELLRALVPALRSAASARGLLTDDELREWNARDLARGRRATSPAHGIVDGITSAGALRIVDAVSGTVRELRSGSLRFEAGPQAP
jgi:BirA family biotin operon repressor/biotin-[acetyl-CoA-carboxylase] ligase